MKVVRQMSRRKLGAEMIVQKFGGIAMRDRQNRAYCIEHIKNGMHEHGNVVVVVSAMGRKGDPYSTDTLLSLTEAFESYTPAKDLAAACGELIGAAVLSAELLTAGVNNKIVHGHQTGILTTSHFGNGTILQIDPTVMLEKVKSDACIIVPGFQGMDINGQIVTLGRGGSDLTAIGIAAALQAYHVEFYKDVEGVMTTDPTTSNDYKKLETIQFDEFLPLLDCSHPIIQKRAALYAIQKAIPLYIRGIASTTSGTWVIP